MFAVELLELDGGVTIRSYSLHNILAEKMRSLLQQPIRRRNRRQDVYDIWLLLKDESEFNTEDLAQIHAMLVDSCLSKNISPTIDSIIDEKVIAMAREGYVNLKDDVDGELPAFDEAMSRVANLYRSLPWA